jgi:hypothetical protein
LTGWDEANPTQFLLSELNPEGAALFGTNSGVFLGKLFKNGGTQDLTLTYALSSGEIRRGYVRYGTLPATLDPPTDAGAAGQPGDTDDDGDVDLDDLNAVRNNFGTSGQPGLPGDAFPFDGTVDLDDLNGVRNNFGATAGAGSVPEPAAWSLALVSLCGVVAVRVRRRS